MALLTADFCAYDHPYCSSAELILMDCERNNLVSAPGVGGNVPLVTVKCIPRREVAVRGLVI